MSGGSFGYKYTDIRYTYEGCMRDEELEELLQDFCDLLHDLEWWVSGDYSEDGYRKSATEFKKKWLNGYDDNTNARVERLKKNLITQIEKFE